MAKQRKHHGMTPEEIRDLPAVMPYFTAAKAMGISRSTAYEMARAGSFPLPIHRQFGKYPKCLKSELLQSLGIGGEVLAA